MQIASQSAGRFSCNIKALQKLQRFYIAREYNSLAKNEIISVLSRRILRANTTVF